MRKAALAAFFLTAACGNGDNVVIGGIVESTITPSIDFTEVNSVISGRITLRDANGEPTDQAEVVLISDRPNLCQKLTEQRDYLRTASETYRTMILYLPATDHLGTFLPGRPGDEGTRSEIVGGDPSKVAACTAATTKPVVPFTNVNTAVVAPMPRASVTVAAAVNAGARRRVRAA